MADRPELNLPIELPNLPPTASIWMGLRCQIPSVILTRHRRMHVPVAEFAQPTLVLEGTQRERFAIVDYT